MESGWFSDVIHKRFWHQITAKYSTAISYVAKVDISIESISILSTILGFVKRLFMSRKKNKESDRKQKQNSSWYYEHIVYEN